MVAACKPFKFVWKVSHGRSEDIYETKKSSGEETMRVRNWRLHQRSGGRTERVAMMRVNSSEDCSPVPIWGYPAGPCVLSYPALIPSLSNELPSSWLLLLAQTFACWIFSLFLIFTWQLIESVPGPFHKKIKHLKKKKHIKNWQDGNENRTKGHLMVIG